MQFFAEQEPSEFVRRFAAQAVSFIEESATFRAHSGLSE
jgi:hypothetical protein